MALQINGKNIGEARYARPDGTLASIGEARVWDGQWRTVYTSMDTVVITEAGAGQARDRLRAALTDYGLDYRTVTELPFRLDTSNVTNMGNMFNGCSSLVTAPEMDTSNVTTMNYMFQNCSALTRVPDMDTRNVTNVYGMFRDCSSLTDGNVRLIGKHPNAITALMIYGSGLTREPFYDTNGNPI